MWIDLFQPLCSWNALVFCIRNLLTLSSKMPTIYILLILTSDVVQWKFSKTSSFLADSSCEQIVLKNIKTGENCFENLHVFLKQTANPTSNNYTFQPFQSLCSIRSVVGFKTFKPTSRMISKFQRNTSKFQELRRCLMFKRLLMSAVDLKK